MSHSARLTSQIGVAQVSVANTNLNGTGTIVPLVTGGGTYGSLVSSITVKAVGNTTPGMVRIFLQDTSSNIFLLEEFTVYACDINTNYGIIESYSSTLMFPSNGFKLSPGWTLLAATQNSETFNVISDGYIYDYCPC